MASRISGTSGVAGATCLCSSFNVTKVHWMDEAHRKIVLTCMSDLIHLKTLPKEFCHLSSLQYLHLRCPDMKSLLDSFGFLTNLQHLNVSRCRSLHRLPNSFGNLIRLKYLHLEYCFEGPQGLYLILITIGSWDI